ncbi:MAG: hypothetical protein EP338_04880 [Bacteroidetes bacterium]|nr:MAG: hypothetical protein EP338_04880 [Bacteroidota bacterium]
MYQFLILFFLAYAGPKDQSKELDQVLDQWHQAASEAQFEKYFSLMSDHAVFIGTAPGERWDKKSFMEFSKPYFDRGKAWDFKPLSRHWSFSKDGKTAWFDEVLDTWMMDCSGSGVLIKEGKTWKIAFYDLHVLIENEKMNSFLELRKEKSKD